MALLNVLVVNAGSTSLKLSLVDESGRSTPVDGFVEADAVGHRIVHLGDLVVGAAVNLEVDVVAKYVERLVTSAAGRGA